MERKAKNKRNGFSAAGVAVLGMAVAASMILSYVESFFYLGIPGIKPGLANIFIIFILYRIGTAEAICVSAVRCILTALLFGTVMSLWYSLAGAALSIFMMWLFKKLFPFTPLGISVVGGISHNAAQIAVAIAVTGVSQIGAYLPVLCVSGTVAGTVVGIIAIILIKRIPIKFTES